MLFSRLPAMLASLAILAACAAKEELEAPVELGNFKPGFLIVVADNPQKLPISREADPQDWDDALTAALEERFKDRYHGDKFFHIGVGVDVYALAPPGIPLVAAPKSVLVVTATLWDDEAGKKVNPDGERITVFEGVDGETLVGSGLTRSADQQMKVLSRNAAQAIERWLGEHPEWFGLPAKPKPEATTN